MMTKERRKDIQSLREYAGDAPRSLMNDDLCRAIDDLLVAHDYWRQQIRDSYPVSYYGVYDAIRCYFCAKEFRDSDECVNAGNHPDDCAWKLSQEQP